MMIIVYRQRQAHVIDVDPTEWPICTIDGERMDLKCIQPDADNVGTEDEFDPCEMQQAVATLLEAKWPEGSAK